MMKVLQLNYRLNNYVKKYYINRINNWCSYAWNTSCYHYTCCTPSNSCTVKTISAYYDGVPKDSIIKNGDTISFKQYNKTVEVGTFNTDIVCNGY